MNVHHPRLTRGVARDPVFQPAGDGGEAFSLGTVVDDAVRSSCPTYWASSLRRLLFGLEILQDPQGPQPAFEPIARMSGVANEASTTKC